MSISTSPSPGARLKAHVNGWVARHLVDVDPHPELSRLDLLDRPDASATGLDLEPSDRDRQLVDANQDVAS